MTNVEQTEQDYAIVKGLTETEYINLMRCEQIIAEGINTFVKVGNALMEIRDQRLYRERYPTFEEYVGERWSMSRSRAYQMIQAAAVTTSLSTMVDKPRNERQVRALAKVPVEHRDQVWEGATKTAAAGGRPVTARDVVDNAEIIAEQTGLDAATVRRAAKALDQFERAQKDGKVSDVLAEQVDAGKIDIEDAVKIIGLPKDVVHEAGIAVTPFEAATEVGESELTGDSYNLQQLKHFWKRAGKSDKREFRQWIGVCQ